MKKVITLLICISMTGSAICQAYVNPGKEQNHYLQKSKNLKTTGWIVFAGGLTIAAVGGLIQLNDWRVWKNDTEGWDFVPDFRGAYTAVAGGCVAVLSTPFFIFSGVNKKNAASISLSQQQILFPQKYELKQKWVPGFMIAIKI
jgi:hypothetical protein